MIDVVVKIGDVLDEVADVLIATANPWLNLSGGVNGAILLRGGQDVQDELHAHLRAIGKAAVEAGAVVQTCPGPLRVKHILHAVAIDPFYNSSRETVRLTLERALTMAQALDARTVAMPALATGYGRLSMQEFAAALCQATAANWPPIEQLRVVLRKADNANIVQEAMRHRDKFAGQR